LDSNQEGICSAGPTTAFCSVTSYVACGLNGDLDCRPPSVGGNCPWCGETETCITGLRQCFVNTGIIRIGTPRSPNPNGDGVSAATYCVPQNGGAIDTSAGFAGPGAVIQPESVIVIGSP